MVSCVQVLFAEEVVSLLLYYILLSKNGTICWKHPRYGDEPAAGWPILTFFHLKISAESYD